MKRSMYEMCKCSPEEIVELKLIESAFNKTKIDESFCSNINWENVFEDLKAQAVASVAIDVVCDMGDRISDDVLKTWISFAMKTVSRNEKILYYQSELIELLGEIPCDAIILKGTSASRYYPNPIYRTMGDIDILVDKRVYKQALQLMLNNDYIQTHEFDETRHHVELKKNKVIFELHREPSGISAGSYGEKIRKIFYDNINNIDCVNINGYKCNSYTKKCNGLVLLLHIVNHIDFGLGLRQVCDWMGFVKEELDDEYWYREFAPMLREIGLEKLAIIVTKLCKMYLGLDGLTWCDSADEKICAEFMRYVLDKGNFGHKKNDTPGTVAVLGRNKEFKSKFFIVNFIHSMQREGFIEMKRDNRRPKIKCLVWTYPILQYFIKLITGKKTIKHTKKLFKEIRQDKSLRDKLDIYK